VSELALLLDIDGTLTPARQDLEREMAEALCRLAVPFHVAAGSDLPLVRHQFLEPLLAFGFRGAFEGFVSNGAARYRCDFSEGLRVAPISAFEIREHLGDDYGLLVTTLEEILDDPAFALPADQIIAGERIIDRGGMVNFAPAGRPKGRLDDRDRRSREQFVAFDRATGLRLRIKTALEERLSRLVAEKGLHIMLGGQTSFDIVVRGKDKTNAVTTLLDEGVEHIVFLGDALHPGGNDSVIREWVEAWSGPGACPLTAIEVTDPADTLRTFADRGWLRAET
jgi:phosphomannomutase